MNTSAFRSVSLATRRFVRSVVLEPGKYRVFRRESDRDVDSPGGSQGWYVHEEGTISLDVVPLALTYSQKVSDFVSTPPLLSIANLNISHAQRECGP